MRGKNKVRFWVNIVCIVLFFAILLFMLWDMNKVKQESTETMGNEYNSMLVDEDSIFGYVKKGDLDKVISALNSGIDINIINLMNNQNLLHYALAYEQYEVAKYLIENGIEKDICDNYGNTPIMLAVYAGQQEIYDLLKDGTNLKAVDSLGNTLLHLAASSGVIEIYEDLVSKGLDVNAVNGEGNTSVYYAYDSQMLLVIMSHMNIENLSREMAEQLLFTAMSPKMVDYLVDEQNVDINIKDSEGNNALFYAMMNGVEDVFEELILKGIAVDNKNNEGNTILHICAGDNAVEYAELLLKANVDKSITNNEGLTPYELANDYQNVEMIELLGGN